MEPIQLVREMVEIPSLSGHEQAIGALLVTRMGELRFEAHIDDAGNAVGSRVVPNAAGDITRTLVLLGHMDVVPGIVPVRIEDGALYGRGTVDAKGPLAAFILATSRATLPAGTRVVVIGAVEEEAASSKGARFVRDTMPAPDACIIGEPSSWSGVTLGYKGRLVVDYTRTQEGGHTAGPVDAVAEAGVAFWNAIRAHAEMFNATRQALFDQLLPTLQTVNTTTDGLHDAVSMTVGFRLPPGFDIDAFERTLRSFAGEDAHVRIAAREVAHQSPRTTPLARTFARALLEKGTKAHFKRKTGTSDMNVVGPAWNCPIVAYGPGDSTLDHTPNEHLPIAELEEAIDVLTRVLSMSTF